MEEDWLSATSLNPFNLITRGSSTSNLDQSELTSANQFIVQLENEKSDSEDSEDELPDSQEEASLDLSSIYSSSEIEQVVPDPQNEDSESEDSEKSLYNQNHVEELLEDYEIAELLVALENYNNNMR